jgi:hypothetical protein
MATFNFTGTVTDPLGVAASDTLAVTSTAPAPLRVVKRSWMANRVNWGSAVDTGTNGPTFSDERAEVTYATQGRTCPPQPVTVSQSFTLDGVTGVRFTGCRIYKAPNAVGDITVSIWSAATLKASTGTLLGSQVVGTWVADEGGWRQVTFSTPVVLDPALVYYVGFCVPNGIYAWSPYVYNAQDTVVWPMICRAYTEDGSGGSFYGTALGFDTANAPVNSFPYSHTPTGYYIDPQIEWDDKMPGYTGGTEYFNQWTNNNGMSRYPFMFAIDFSDPQYIQEYWDMGMNCLLGGDPTNANYIAAMSAIGNQMDWIPYINPGTPGVAQSISEHPAIASSVIALQIDDEPDQQSHPEGFHSPAMIQGWVNYYRQRDSTRPLYQNFGYWVSRNQGFGFAPNAGSILDENRYWRLWAQQADILSCDNYTLSNDNNPDGRYGPWMYACTVAKVREVCDDTKPVFAIIETTSQTPGQPIPSDVIAASWASVIAGARGLDYFDHRFAGNFVSQDFAAMLHDPPMKAAVSALAARVMPLGPALMAPDTNIVTAYTSSNKTSGPLGGTFGVPMHYMTRSAGGHEYLFAMGIRPGATTATFTIPTWAGATVTVVDESRTVTVSGAGILTDNFAADYSVHIYRK